jgi:hypothetical protein
MEPVTLSNKVRRAIYAKSHEIIDQTLLEIWRRPSLSYMREMVEWELRAWLLGILSRAGYSDTSLGFVHFSRPFPWHEAVETVRILMRRTSSAVEGNPETEADLRRFFNQYLIRLGEHYEARFPRTCSPRLTEIRGLGEAVQSGRS